MPPIVGMASWAEPPQWPPAEPFPRLTFFLEGTLGAPRESRCSKPCEESSWLYSSSPRRQETCPPDPRSALYVPGGRDRRLGGPLQLEIAAILPALLIKTDISS